MRRQSSRLSPHATLRQGSDLAAASGMLAGLVLDKQVIQRVLRRELMQESVIYQALRAEARQEIRLEEARLLILRQLTRKVGDVSLTLKAQIEALDLTQLEALGEALLNFDASTDLRAWLAQLPP